MNHVIIIIFISAHFIWFVRLIHPSCICLLLGEKGLADRLRNVLESDFARITYTDAITLLHSEIAAGMSHFCIQLFIFIFIMDTSFIFKFHFLLLSFFLLRCIYITYIIIHFL